MTFFIPIAGAAVVGYSILYFQWRRGRGAGLFVLSTLPLVRMERPAPIRSSWVTLLLTTCAAAAFQALATRPDPDPDATPATDATTHTSNLGTWTLMLSSTALIPSVVLAHVMLDTLRMVTFASRQTLPAGAGQALTEEAVSQLSSAIAARVTSGMGFGVSLTLLIGGVAFANVVAARFARESPLARIVSWAAFVLVVASGVSLLFTMAAL